MKGRKQTEEARHKNSMAHRKENLSQETRSKMSENGKRTWGTKLPSKKGVKLTEEHKKKISDSLRKRYHKDG